MICQNPVLIFVDLNYLSINNLSNLSWRTWVNWKTGVRISKIWGLKGKDQMSKTSESKSEGIANSNWQNRDTYIIN